MRRVPLVSTYDIAHRVGFGFVTSATGGLYSR